MYPDTICLSVTGSLAGYDIFSALDTARTLGFQSVAAMPDGAPKHSLGRPLPTLGYESRGDEHWRRMREALARFRRVSIHQSWDTNWRAWFDAAQAVGGEVVTVHARLPGPASPDQIAARARELEEWGRYAADRGVVIGIENEGGRASDFLALVENIKSENVGVTLDVGHCAFFAEVPRGVTPEEMGAALNTLIEDIVRRIGARLNLLHVHNVQPFESVEFERIPNPYWHAGSVVDHRRTDRGLIDFPRLFAGLREVGYTGMFELEMEEPDILDAARVSADHLTALLREG